MHYFSHSDKIKLYSKIYRALKSGCKYIECDYMMVKQKDEDFYHNESMRIHKELNIPQGEIYHIDVPCTIDNQIILLKRVGFQKADMVWKMGNTTIIVAQKEQNKSQYNNTHELVKE